MRAIYFVVLILMANSASGQIYPMSGINNCERELIKKRLTYSDAESKYLISQIDASSKIVKIYLTYFNSLNDFTFHSEILDYLSFGRSDIWFYKNMDSVIGLAEESCSTEPIALGPIVKDLSDLATIDRLSKSDKVDLMNSCFFYIHAHQELFVAIGKKAFVVTKDDTLEEFNDYFKKRFTIEAFRKSFIIELR